MANQFLNLPAPASNSAGAAVDVSALGATKTVVVKGNGTAFEPFVVIEATNDPSHLEWTPVWQFNKPGERTFNVACAFMRARVTGYVQGGAPTVDVGSSDIGTQSATLVATAGNGDGAGVDVSTLGDFTTIQVAGTYKGAVNIQVSNDGGSSWALADGFSFVDKGSPQMYSAILTANFFRVSRSGIPDREPNPGLPVIYACGSELGSGGGGSSTSIVGSDVLTFRPGSGLSGPLVFDDWDDLYAQLESLRTAADESGEFTIVIDNTDDNPVIPAGDYDLAKATLIGVAGMTTISDTIDLEISTGATITNLRSITGLSIAATDYPIKIDSDQVLTVRGCALESVIEAIGTEARGALIIDDEVLLNADTTAVNLAAGADLTVMLDGANADLGTDQFSCDSTETLSIIIGSTSATVGDQTGFGGTLEIRSNAASALYHQDPNTEVVSDTGNLLVTPIGVFQNTSSSSWLRVVPRMIISPTVVTEDQELEPATFYVLGTPADTGHVTLPAASSVPNGTPIGVRISTDDNWTIDPDGSDTINGDPELALTGEGAYAVLLSNGTDQWVTEGLST